MNSWEYGWGVILVLLTLSFSQSSEEPGAQIGAFHFKRYIDVKEESQELQMSGLGEDFSQETFQNTWSKRYFKNIACAYFQSEPMLSVSHTSQHSLLSHIQQLTFLLCAFILPFKV